MSDTESKNGNACNRCQHRWTGLGAVGHCYMFRTEPRTCLQYKSDRMSAVNEAQKILTIADRTPKERRDMAEFYAVRYDWKGDTATAWFADGSCLMMAFDSDLCPIEMIEVSL